MSRCREVPDVVASKKSDAVFLGDAEAGGLK